MKKKLFICSDRSFPRGDAGANRILYMAKALIDKGWDVFVISIGRNDDRFYNSDQGCYIYEGIKYFNIKTSSNRIVRSVEHNFLDGRRVVSLLKKFGVCNQDRILLYSSAYLFTSALLAFSQKNSIKMACDVVEWHQPFQYKKGKKDISYILYKSFFNKLLPKIHNIIAISRYLEEHFEKVGCNVLTIPIYIDVDKRNEPIYSLNGESINLIYPGNPYRKDDLLSMLSAINQLPNDKKEKVVFHLTGVSLQLLRQCIPGNEVILEKLIESGNVIVHSWMEYDDLIKLYSKIDFALIARPINIVTKANFPSKVPELFNKGIPVIINRVGDIAEYLSDGYDSIMYDGEGVEKCKEAILRVLSLSENERKMLRRNAYISAYEKFDYRNCSTDLDRFFSTLV